MNQRGVEKTGNLPAIVQFPTFKKTGFACEKKIFRYNKNRIGTLCGRNHFVVIGEGHKIIGSKPKGAIKVLYLNTQTAQPYACAFRHFFEGEHHITRRFPQSVLLLVLEGTLYFEEDDMPVAVSQGEWYIQRANLLQTGKRGSPAPIYFYLHFDGGFQELEESPTFCLPLSGKFDRQTLRPLLEKLVNCQQEAASQELFEVSLFRSLLYFLYCSDRESRNDLPYRILNMVSSQIDRPLSLSSLAKEMGYCEDYLGRVFRRQYGVSLCQYANRLRVQRAKQLLRETSKTIEQIGREVGCPEVSRFYRLFRRETGMAPSQWRATGDEKQCAFSEKMRKNT